MRSRSSLSILTAIAVAALCATTAACSKIESPAVPGGASHGSAAKPTFSGDLAYEVVTVQRPESVDAFHKLHYYEAYKMCAATRKILKLPPPPPMKIPPADYISQRTTYVSDGKAYLDTVESFMYMVKTEGTPGTCETYLQKRSTTTLVRDGKLYIANIDEEGKRQSEPVEEWTLPRDGSKEKNYTEPKIVKGYAVKCMRMLPGLQKQLTELCIADLKPGTLTGPSGEPIVISSRVTIAESLIGQVLTEPVTIKVGEKTDKALFDAAAAP